MGATVGLVVTRGRGVFSGRIGLDVVFDAGDPTQFRDNVEVEHQALLVGVRSPGRRAFATASAGIAAVTRINRKLLCEACAEEKTTRHDGAFVAELAGRANAVVVGAGLKTSLMIGPSVKAINVMLSLGLGNFRE